MFAALTALAVLAEQAPGAAVPAPPLPRSVLVIVRDGKSGDPIPDTPVRWLGTQVEGRTDQNGQCVLTDTSGSISMRIWTESPVRTQDVRTMSWLQGWDAVELWTAPKHRYVSPVLRAETGGNHAFKALDGGSATTVEVTVAPGTFDRDLSLGFAQLATFSADPATSRDLVLFRGQLSALDLSGACALARASLPVHVRVETALPEGCSEGFLPVMLFRFDQDRHEFRAWASVQRLDALHGAVEFDLAQWNPGWNAFQIACETSRTEMPLEVTVESTEHEVVASSSIHCGRLQSDLEVPAALRDAVSLSPDLGRAVASALPGAPRLATAWVASRTGVELTLSPAGNLGGSMSARWLGRHARGQRVAASCTSGSADLVLVRVVYAVAVEGRKVGTIRRPLVAVLKRKVERDTSCADTESWADPLPHSDFPPQR